MRRRMTGITAAVLLLAAMQSAGWQAARAETGSAPDAGADVSAALSREYDGYYDTYSGENAPSGFIEIGMESALPGGETDTVDGMPAMILRAGGTGGAWEFTVEQTGVYGIRLGYYPLPGDGKDILVSVTLDGEAPHTASGDLTLHRLWRDVRHGGEGYFERDGQGNDIRPVQEEASEWTEQALQDVRGLYAEPYLFYLEAGTHTIGLTATQGDVAVGRIRIGNEEPAPDYAEYIRRYEGQYAGGREAVLQQAERAWRKSSRMLYATYDRSNAATQPNSPSVTKLNTIGQSNWSTVGDAISWLVEVPEAGLYRLSLRVRQNINSGMKSYRTLRINGKIPFAQAEDIGFRYQQKWYVQTLGGEDEPYYVYLEPGDVLTLTCTPGEISGVLRSVNRLVLDLNAIYRDIIAVTSTTPDIYRDYSLEKQIPDLEDSLNAAARRTEETAKQAAAITGTAGSQASVLTYVSKILRELAADPYSIPERLSRFKGGIESLGSLVLTLGRQPLELDYLAYVPREAELPRAGVSLWESVSFGVRQFVSSFTADYNRVSASDGGTGVSVNVWASTGRDQARIISRLIANDFMRDTGIHISLNLVDTGTTLIKAALAGKGPDAALMMPQDMPVNLAAREALADLNAYGTEGLRDSVYPSAWTPFYYSGGLYAYPETQTFDVLFYRTDIFREMGLGVPDTWDELYYVMEILQKSNLMLGIPEINPLNLGVSSGIGIFDKFLLQNGGSYYNDDQTRTRFDEETAYAAFEQWVKLYIQYGLDREYDFYSRFRSGEMPLAIQNYAAYNQLVQAAPELRGLWSIAPIPGTAGEDGAVDRSENGAVTGCVMLNSALQKGIDKETVEFLKWWASAQTQTAYGQELEATLGAAARYTPAAKDALSQMGWSAGELAVLTEQMSQVKIQPQLPSSYVLPRSLTSAFRSAVEGTNQARRALTIYNKTINDEIARKRIEFGLD